MSKLDNIYYIYIHIRVDLNVPFYVGVGTIRSERKYYKQRYYRAHNKSRRTKFWKNIINKTDYRIEVLEESLDEVYILKREQELIQLYGRRDLGSGTLVNLTDGGEGCKRMKMSEEARFRMKENSGMRGILGNKHHSSIEVYQYDLEGNYVGSHKGILDISRKLNIPANKIIDNASGRAKRGDKWMWFYQFKGYKISPYKPNTKNQYTKQLNKYDKN